MIIWSLTGHTFGELTAEFHLPHKCEEDVERKCMLAQGMVRGPCCKRESRAILGTLDEHRRVARTSLASAMTCVQHQTPVNVQMFDPQ